MASPALKTLARALWPANVPRTVLAAPSILTPLISRVRTLTTEPVPPQQSQTTPTQSPRTPAPNPQLLPYFVGRNRMDRLGIYQRRNRGGNLKKTLLKNGEGNLQALREDVARALGLTEKEVRVNNVTKHIEVKVLHPPLAGPPSAPASPANHRTGSPKRRYPGFPAEPGLLSRDSCGGQPLSVRGTAAIACTKSRHCTIYSEHVREALRAGRAPPVGAHEKCQIDAHSKMRHIRKSGFPVQLDISPHASGGVRLGICPRLDYLHIPYCTTVVSPGTSFPQRGQPWPICSVLLW